jgi:hypothetical protein
MTLKNPLFLQNDTTDQSADIVRLFIRDLVNERPGVVQGNAMLITQRGAGANNSVDIGPGAIIIPGTSVTNQGYYHVVNDATVNLPMSTPAHGSLPRIDTILVKVRDGFYSGPDNDGQFLYVAGTAAASPVAPDLVALGHVNFWRLANVSVPANDNTISTADITDVRTSTSITPTQGSASSVGGCIICTSASRPTLPRSGQLIWETDTKRLVINEGTPSAAIWQPISHNNTWTSFAPTFAGVTVGSGGSTGGNYIKLGRLAIARFGFTLGASGFSVPTNIVWTPPAVITSIIPPAAPSIIASFGWANNSNVRYGGVGIVVSTGEIGRWASDGDSIGWGTTIPFTWGAGDGFGAVATYETTT